MVAIDRVLPGLWGPPLLYRRQQSSSLQSLRLTAAILQSAYLRQTFSLHSKFVNLLSPNEYIPVLRLRGCINCATIQLNSCNFLRCKFVVAAYKYYFYFLHYFSPPLSPGGQTTPRTHQGPIQTLIYFISGSYQRPHCTYTGSKLAPQHIGSNLAPYYLGSNLRLTHTITSHVGSITAPYWQQTCATITIHTHTNKYISLSHHHNFEQLAIYINPSALIYKNNLPYLQFVAISTS